MIFITTKGNYSYFLREESEVIIINTFTFMIKVVKLYLCNLIFVDMTDNIIWL